MTTRIAGALNIAHENLAHAQSEAERLRSNGGQNDVLDDLRSDHLVERARNLLTAVERQETDIQAWETNPDRQAALIEMQQLETKGLETLHAKLDKSIAVLVEANKHVQAYNEALRSATRRARAGEPGGGPAGGIALHPGEQSLRRYVVEALARAGVR